MLTVERLERQVIQTTQGLSNTRQGRLRAVRPLGGGSVPDRLTGGSNQNGDFLRISVPSERRPGMKPASRFNALLLAEKGFNEAAPSRMTVRTRHAEDQEQSDRLLNPGDPSVSEWLPSATRALFLAG